ncbi:hypothetical protein DL96DRAFT_1604901 [Flagelloscypha sp. PMI_526]|nr:hypothetical protein DL96DRAFT_1604901 [Flagelloscypha sp. PMI_526]
MRTPTRSPITSRFKGRPYNIYEISDNENDLMHWENPPTFSWTDEKTLVSDLIDAPSSDTEGHDSKKEDAFIRLEEAFALEGKKMAHDIASELFPAVKSLKKTFASATKTFDQPFRTAILAFNDGCKDFEELRIDEEATLDEAYQSCKMLTELACLPELETAYKARDALWTALQADMDKIKSLKDAPTKIERLITNLEKHAKQFKNNPIDPTIQALLAGLD